MRVDVSFQNFPVMSTFNDAKDYDLEVDRTFINKIKQLVDKGRGKAVASGVKPIQREGDYYVLTTREADQVHSMLFELEPEETSRLVGIHPHADRKEAMQLLYKVLSERIDEVNLVI